MSTRFVCRVGTPDGRVQEEVFEAVSEAAARADLEGRGYHVFDVRRRGVPFRLSLPSAQRYRRVLSDREFLVFNQELAGLLRAGLPLLQALDLMLERQEEGPFRTILGEVRDKVKSGMELSEAFAESGAAFPPLYASTLKAGERSGELEQVIRRFIRYMKLVMETKKRVVSALVYPAVLVGLSLVMIGVMMVYVIPRFQGFYDAMDVELPFLTQVIVSLSHFLKSLVSLRALPIWALVGIAVWLTSRRLGQPGMLTHWWDRMKLSVPLAGSVLQRFSISEFSRSMSTLLAGGLPLVPALEVSVGAVGNSYLKKRLDPVVPAVREGRPFYLALEETGVFDRLSIDMVKVGEATGSLDEMMTSVSDFLDEEIETLLQRMLSLIEPIMLVVMGSAVALLLAAMYLPLFSILGQVQ